MKVKVQKDNRLKIAVVGPGAIGCLFAGLLARAGHKVTLLDHRPSRARILSRKGITIQTAEGARVVRVPATANAAETGIVDIIFICVKAYDTAAAISSAAMAVGPRTIVVSMQNGLGNAETIARVVDSPQIVCGITGHGVICLGHGRVFHAGAGRTRVAALLPGCRHVAKRVAKVLRGAGLDTTVAGDVKGMLWSKLIVNAAINPLTVILDIPNGQLLNNTVAHSTMLKAAAEAAAVAEANGISLLFRDSKLEVEAVCRKTRDNFSSMLQDVRRRHRTEIDSITGAIVRTARKTRVDVPVNRMLLRQVRIIENCSQKQAAPKSKSRVVAIKSHSKAL
ncbi:MAG: 2-dehydropantoate 2-reductase [bacterium]